MGVFGDLAGNIKNKIESDKAEKERLRREIQNNRGTEAICSYMFTLFEKGNAGYNWLKANRKFPLYPVVGDAGVELCYTQYASNPQSLREMKPKNIRVSYYCFQEMYSWYGLAYGEGYLTLNNKVQKDWLCSMINQRVQQHNHIKYTTGWELKLFG